MKIKYYLIILLLFQMFFLVGCYDKEVSHNLNFEGKSEHWKIILNVKDSSSKEYNFYYIGKDTKPREFEYQIYNDHITMQTEEGKGSLETQDEFTIIEQGSNLPITKINAFKVNIKWDNKEEELKLKFKK